MIMAKEIEDLLPTRRTLLSRLRDWEDGESWNAFFETYWKLIYNAAMRSGLSDAEAQDVVQETVISVSKSMPNFRYDPKVGSFKSWLLQLTRWRILDQLRKRHPENNKFQSMDESARTDMIERIADPATSHLDDMWDDEWEKNLMSAAIDRVKKKADPKHYQIFDLYVMKEWPVTKITSHLKINAGLVYLAKHRVSALIKKELKYLNTKVS
jgi:RNA polymerase sigma factor (sigma-70 family)